MVVIVLLSIVTQAFGQSASLPSNAYRPGRYLPLRLEAPAAGTVTVFGSGLQPIEWAAAGKSSVVVPLFVYRENFGGGLFVNGRDAAMHIDPLVETDRDPPDLVSFWQTYDPAAGAGPATDEQAYATANLWQPGRSPTARRWMLVAVGIAVLVLGVARHADPKRATRWLALAGLGLMLLSVFLPVDAVRRVLPAEGRAGWEWVWYAGGPTTVTEPWSPGLRYVPGGPTDVMKLTPTLHCDAAGRPTGISVDLPAGGRAVFIRPRPAGPLSRRSSPPASAR